MNFHCWCPRDGWQRNLSITQKLWLRFESDGGVLLTPTRDELNLLDEIAVDSWFIKNKPDVVIIAAAKVGGMEPMHNILSNF